MYFVLHARFVSVSVGRCVEVTVAGADRFELALANAADAVVVNGMSFPGVAAGVRREFAASGSEWRDLASAEREG